MKIILIGLFFCLNFISGQNKRFIYEYTFSNDSTNLESKKSELLVLDTSLEGSVFYSNKINEIDSLYNLRDPKGNPPQFYPYRDVLFREIIINKKNNTPKLYYMGGPTRNYFEVILDNKIQWTIFPETKTYENYKIQKATAIINKRQWEIWFTKEIPLNIGPYIFQGLPGLIIIAEDRTKSQSFKLVGISNLGDVDLNFIPMFQSKQRESLNTKVTLTPKEFKNLLINNDDLFVNNIVQLSNNESEIVSSKFYDSSGNEISKSDYIKNQREARRAILKRNNNKLINDFKR
ncbi:GLPGLI family protein [Chryseobacterium nepalense]|uniref:GLPGLI family protein n=1 Tax=Chryseobacterium nepalense TaxID=1854498 RepID=UPI002DFAD6EF|nr:GLPGLI family protein [Chryseobacterium nepalense]